MAQKLRETGDTNAIDVGEALDEAIEVCNDDKKFVRLTRNSSGDEASF